jgi:type VI secretion system protein ImpM
MRCGLFGKLVAKRDFIALSAPREFLSAWEPWMQSCVSASRDELKDAWLDAYLTAPIWRFWLGPEVCGKSVLGAVMSSLDGMGRYYPLTLFAYQDREGTIAPPDINSQEPWFFAAEELLLSTLDKEMLFETVASAVDRLVPPDPPPASASEDVAILRLGVLGAPLRQRSFSELFTTLRTAHSATVYAGASFWWTVGGGDCEPFGFCCYRMPQPAIFTGMLTGRIAEAGD